MITRRTLLAAPAALLAPRSARAADAEVSVLVNETGATISPLIHSQFVEHLGGVIYDGIWVGEGSKIPNVAGLRKSLIDACKRIKAPLFRWPGGCFADSYNWRDGIGPRAGRPRRSNFWINSGALWKAPDGPAKYDPNAFGSNEFARFCQETTAQAYFAANVRSATARDFYDWVEYCNSPSGSTTLADQRGTAPFNVEYWGIGNESWGCGGDMTPEEYSLEFRKFTSWLPNFGLRLKYIPTGPNGGDLNWTRGFFDQLRRKSPGLINRVWGWALHYYCGTSGQGNSIEFTTDDWYDLLARANRIESLITDHWTIMGEYDREHRVKFAIDEWGAWHRAGLQAAPHHLFGYFTSMRDAVITGLTLDVFHRHADKVGMANAAQTINCIHSLFFAHEDKFVATPTYHVFDLYKDHQGARSVRTVFGSPLSPKGAPGVAGSASLRDKTLVLTAVNTSVDQPANTVIKLHGASARGVKADVLAGDRPQAHNTFERPHAVVTRTLAAQASGASVRVEMPPASVARLLVELA